MFSASIYIRSSDGHAIYDNDTKQVINKPENLYIGNHVWLCNGATILKNTVISDNSIVAKNSVVTKKFYEKNIIIAGIPAKKVKGNINWDRKNTFSYEQELELSSRINNKTIIEDYDA